MLLHRFITSSLAIILLLTLLSCGANVCFTGSSPQIISVTPGTILTGSSTVQVIVVGNNFSDGTVLIFNDGTQIVPTTITPSRMTFTFGAGFFNGIGTIHFHLSDPCRGASNTTVITVVEHF